MSSLHAFLGAAWTYLAVAGLATFAAKWWLRRQLEAIDTPEAFETPGVFLALVSTSLVPFVWLLSAAIHSSGYGEWAAECCRWVSLQGPSWQQFVFIGGALGLIGSQCVSMYRRWQRRHGSHDSADDLARRARSTIRELASTTPVIESHLSSIRVVQCPDHICAVRGFVEPRLEISASLVHELDRPALRAALLHEIAHLHHGDSLRTAVSLFADILNPFSRWLGRERRAWQFAREIRCDRRALDYGIKPVHLADALVTAARTRADAPSRDSELCHLCGDGSRALETRVELLLFDAHEPLEADAPSRDLVYLSGALLAASLLPHIVDGLLLECHCWIEWMLA